MIFQIQIYKKKRKPRAFDRDFIFFLTLLLEFCYFHCHSHHVSSTNLGSLFNPRFKRKKKYNYYMNFGRGPVEVELEVRIRKKLKLLKLELIEVQKV